MKLNTVDELPLGTGKRWLGGFLNQTGTFDLTKDSLFNLSAFLAQPKYSLGNATLASDLQLGLKLYW